MTGLSGEMIDDYNDNFQLFDKQQKGYVKTDILKEMLRFVGYNPTDQQFEEMTIEVDENGNGQIEFEEFLEITEKLNPPEVAEKSARDAFNAFDFLGQGFVSADDLKEALKYIMEKAPEADKQNIIKHFRLSKNRKIYFQEFKDMITMRR